MDRDEILRRNKDAKAKDEGEEYVEARARRFGEFGLVTFLILLSVYKGIKGMPFQDIVAIVWAYLGVSYVYKYIKMRSSRNLTAAICGMIAAVCFLLSYILNTM